MKKKIILGICLTLYTVSFLQENTVISGGEATGKVNQCVQQPFDLFIDNVCLETLEGI